MKNQISKINYFEELERLSSVKEKIIYLFERYETLTKTDLMKHLKLSHQTITGRLAQLQDDGKIFVFKTKRNRNGRLLSVYKLTPESDVENLKLLRQIKKKNDLLSRLLNMDISEKVREAILDELHTLTDDKRNDYENACVYHNVDDDA